MTQQQLFDAVRALGLVCRRTDWGDYRVAYPGDEASAYYTDDREDALFTARHMAGVRDEFFR
ncbi:MAG: hypothetical protein JSS43_17505 [Proteobacteria bacterium]|nr:hypothetical protein [Pseudomonadota bacterium]